MIVERLQVHDHKGYSEEKCLRCGWVMGHRALNCQNDNTPHVFPSQLDFLERIGYKLRDFIFRNRRPITIKTPNRDSYDC